MGKKLRTRELLSDTDSETDNSEATLPIIDVISSSAIRKHLRTKLGSKPTHSPKANSKPNFILRVQNRNIRQGNKRGAFF